MDMGDIGLALLGTGIGVIGGGGLPTRGKQYPQLLEGYREAIQRKVEPTLDQKGAYANHIFYRIGTALVVVGATIWVGFTLAKLVIGE